jgi:hypothetical protein
MRASGTPSLSGLLDESERSISVARNLAESIVRTAQFGPARPFIRSLRCVYRGDEQLQRRTLFRPLGRRI